MDSKPRAASTGTRPFNQYGGLTLVPMPGFEQLANKVKAQLEQGHYQFDTAVDVAVPEFGVRSSGEPYVRMAKDHIGGHDCVILTSGPGTSEMLLQWMFVLRYLAGRRATRIAAVTGYYPLGRSDKDEGTKEFALPPLINDLMMAATYQKLDRIVAVDLHAPQVVMSGRTGFITEVSLVHRVLRRAVQQALALGEPVCLCYPDDASAKRVEKAVDRISAELQVELPSVYGVKRRRSSRSSQLKELFGDVDALRNATVLNLDDEIATGGTNINSAQELRDKYGAKRVWAVVTHAVMCENAAERFLNERCPVTKVFAADTIPVHNRPHLKPMLDKGLLDIYEWWPDLAVFLYHHHWNLSFRGRQQ